MDVDSNNQIDFCELFIFLNKLCEMLDKQPVTQEYIKNIFEKCDKSKDNKLSYQEIKPFVFEIISKMIESSKSGTPKSFITKTSSVIA